MSKYEFFSGPYFPVFGPNRGKYGPEKTPYLHTFHAEHPKGVFMTFQSPSNNKMENSFFRDCS